MLDPDPEQWLRSVANRLPAHAAILRRLRDEVGKDDRIVQFSVGCSVGRGTADALSDIDCELSLSTDAWPGGLDLVDPLVRRVGEIVELLHHRVAGVQEGRRTAVVYANGIQLDLMVWPVTVWSGMHAPDTVVLHATRPVFTRPWQRASAFATIDGVREWHFLGWWALLDADKYLRRGSAWEARQRLEEARTALWQLCAAAQGLPFPQYGITTLLDAPSSSVPTDVAETAVGLDLAEMSHAVRRCAELLEHQWDAALTAVDGPDDGDRHSALAAWAKRRLEAPTR